jgi:hypothetical protein
MGKNFAKELLGTPMLRVAEEGVWRRFFDDLSVGHEDQGSATWRAKPISWVTQIIVMPSLARPIIVSRTSLAWLAGSLWCKTDLR